MHLEIGALNTWNADRTRGSGMPRVGIEFHG